MTKTEPFDELDTLEPGELRQWWVRRLRNVFRIAARELPFYRERFDGAGFDWRSFHSLDDLTRVPTFGKEDVLAAQARVGSRVGIERLRPSHRETTVSMSSGTSGTTFVWHTARWRRVQGYSSARAHWWAGLRPGGTFILSAPAWHAYASIQPWLVERFGMDCIVVSGTYLPRFADRIIDALVRFRPRFVTMFLPMVFSILAASRRTGLTARDVFGGVEVLVVTGAPITPGMRGHLERETGVRRVAEIAGTSENVLAVDCERGEGLHVVPDTCCVEVLDVASRRPVAPGERGVLVHSMTAAEGSVYLRYESGDAATIDTTPCPCGLPSPRVRVLGRWEDQFALGDRRWLPSDVQSTLEEEVPELVGETFVISRDGIDRGVLRLLLGRPDSGAETRLAEAVRSRLGRRFGAPVEVAWAEDLPVRFKGVAPVAREASVPAR